MAHPLPVSGDSTVTADSPYTLTLGDGWTDLGSGTGISYVVNWGDGTSDPPITADDLASQGDQVTHTYAAVTPATGTAVTYQISVNLVDGTTYSGIGSQSVSVDMTDATTTDLTASPTSASFGGTVTLTATVAAAVSATATPSATLGSVEFYDGTTDLGPGTFADGSFTLATQLLTVGTHSFTAVYSGDGTFDQSTSAAVAVSVSYPNS